jgi:2-keto-3-deoxy-6-phosphogluconate aldolase
MQVKRRVCPARRGPQPISDINSLIESGTKDRAGAQFLVTPDFEKNCVTVAHKFDLPIMAGALTPTEVMAAWEAGADFVKIFRAAT